jgi:hypothetical protein
MADKNVTFIDYAAVKNNNNAPVGPAANQSAESLLEFYYRHRKLIFGESVAALLLYLLDSSSD